MVVLITIRCAIDPRLHAHSKGGWFQKARATKTARAMAKLLAMDSGNKPIKGKARVDYTFFVPDRRRRDEANLVQAAKPLIDGVVDAGMISGDHWEVLSTGQIRVILGGVETVQVELQFSKAF